jgi:hypothetical protein
MLPDVSTSGAADVADVSVPSTVNVDVPEKVSGVVSVTVMPTGIMTISVEINDPGTTPPHVRVELKLPDKTAV